MVPNSEWFLGKMNGLFGLKSWTIERITRIQTDQTILSLLVGSMERAVAFFGDEVRPVHLPPEKKRRAQRCHQMNRTGFLRSVLWA